MDNKTARDVVLKTRNDAILTIAYNINKMVFCQK